MPKAPSSRKRVAARGQSPYRSPSPNGVPQLTPKAPASRRGPHGDHSLRSPSPGNVKNVTFNRPLIQGPTGSRANSEAPHDHHGHGENVSDTSVLEYTGNIDMPKAHIDRERGRVKARKDHRDARITADPHVRFPLSANFKLFATPGHDDAGQDVQVCQLMNSLIGSIVDLADSIPEIEERKEAFMDHILTPENQQLVRYLGCLGLGGLHGEKGWEMLLTEKESRRSFVVGILGMAIKEKVFGDLWFGGDEEQKKQLEDLEREGVEKDGFVRAQERANAIKTFPKSTAHDKNFRFAVVQTTLALSKMLWPFWAIECSKSLRNIIFLRLEEIVQTAGKLGRAMRSSPNVIYYWPPVFKDEEYEPSRMECLNLVHMIKSSPYKRETVKGMIRPILKKGMENKSEAIVRVVCFHGIVAYRQGGGKLAKRELAKDKEGDSHMPADVRRARERVGDGPLTGNEGIRSKTICKSLVLLQWGKQRLLTKEAGTSAHIDANRDGKMEKYEQDSSPMKELYQMLVERCK
ncbi:hypothetical protein TI39_contig385g00021 [Zymoseptoria brevis]|uniref:Uncharacterized protein n=1 Tax=Zymoseptoria brevis TaxID=1047168 RepID=A0A0F4GP71_9PEZI|nr:hypothetical protein TI39_contig385g00021 [Zymoseptoria brevis]